jgi:hypothetical protein
MDAEVHFDESLLLLYNVRLSKQNAVFILAEAALYTLQTNKIGILVPNKQRAWEMCL